VTGRENRDNAEPDAGEDTPAAAEIKIDTYGFEEPRGKEKAAALWALRLFEKDKFNDRCCASRAEQAVCSDGG
jgi:hypothetical protein